MEEEIKQESIVEEKPKKKGNGCLIAILVFFFLIALIIAGGYLGYKKITKSLNTKNLNVTYSQQDYDTLMENLNFEADPSLLCLDCPTPQFSNPHEISLTIPNSQASAAFEYINQHLTYAKISGTQIKMNDGGAELTTTFIFQGQSFPVYLSGTVSKASDNSITGEVYDLKAGPVSLPTNIESLVETTLLGIVNDKLESAGDTVRIDTLKLTKDGLNFQGLIPGKAQ